MNETARTGTVLAVCALVLMVPVLLITMMLGDDTKPCGPAATTTAPSGGGNLPPGSKVWPLAQGAFTIGDGFGARGGAHKGVDLAAAAGTPIYAITDGTVAAAGPASGFGNWVVLNHNIDGHAWSTVYGHMYDDGVLVHTGDQVHTGQLIARVGSNGESTGPHLHFEVWDGGRLSGGTAIDPIPWLGNAGYPGDAATSATAATTAPRTTTPNVAPIPVVTATPPTGTTTASGTPRSGTPTSIGPQPAAAVGGSTTTSPSTRSATSPTSTTCLPGAPGSTGGGTDDLAPGVVPGEYDPWYRKAGQLCPQIKPSLLAAQGKQESGFNPSVVSGAGAQGIAQFMPGTWPGYAQDDDGTGNVSPFNPHDAIMAQGRYMCQIAAEVDGWISDGTVQDVPDRRELYLAAYNAGAGAVQRSHGFPTGSPDYETQTRPYADNIIAMANQYARTMG